MTTLKKLAEMLENSSEDELTGLAYGGYQFAEAHPDLSVQEQQLWGWFMSMIAVEAECRKIEPLWRKAKRFAVRNSGTFKEIGKVAAGVALGVLICDDLTS